MKMLWDPLCHFTGVVSVALRHMFTSAIRNNHIPQGNLDWMCTYTGLKLFFKWEQITVAASAVSSFWHWRSLFHSFVVFPKTILSAAGGLCCRWWKKVCCCCCCCCHCDADQLLSNNEDWAGIYNSGAGDQASRKVSDVPVLINKLNPKFRTSVFTLKWIIEWPGLLCVTDGDVTHCGSAEPSRLTEVFALCRIIRGCTNLLLFQGFLFH